MAVSTFYGLQTALRGLVAQQRSLDVTGHNIGNASTIGYSRQEAVLGASRSHSIAAGAKLDGTGAQLGAGVEVVEYRRQRNVFLDAQYRAQTTQLGDATARTEALSAAEGALAEPGNGSISKAMEEFWSAWTALGLNPENGAAKQVVVSAAQTLADRFHAVDGQLVALRDNAQSEHDTLMAAGGRVDNIAKELAGLNGAIAKLTAVGEQPLDLMDRRDLLLDELSGLGQVTTALETDGTVTVGFGDAAATEPLVAGTTKTWPLTTLSNAGGRIGALADLAKTGGVIEGYRDDLSTAATAIKAAVNAVHGSPPVFTGTTAATLGVGITPATVDAGTGGSGSNDIAKAVAALRGGGAEQVYSGFVSKLASAVSSAGRTQATLEALQGAVDDRRASEAGVSLDEEMSNMVRFQRAYQASSRMLSTVDDVLDQLINRTGRVGL